VDGERNRKKINGDRDTLATDGGVDPFNDLPVGMPGMRVDVHH
jgi:hypothetical protein